MISVLLPVTVQALPKMTKAVLLPKPNLYNGGSSNEASRTASSLFQGALDGIVGGTD